jgi:hypothetical protein
MSRNCRGISCAVQLSAAICHRLSPALLYEHADYSARASRRPALTCSIVKSSRMPRLLLKSPLIQRHHLTDVDD